MAEGKEINAPEKLEGHFKAMAICWLLGLGSLVAWNSVLTIGDYYGVLFPDYHPSRVLTLVYQPFAFISMGILAYKEATVNTRKRILVGYTLFFIGTLMMIVVDLVTSGHGGIGPYVAICAMVGVFGVADGHVQGGVIGDLSLMCPEFIQSFFAGLAASGALTSALRLITRAAFEKYDHGLRKGTIMFLSLSTFIEFLCIFLYAMYFSKLPIVKHYRAKAASQGSKTVMADLAAGGIQTQLDVEAIPQRLTTKQLFIQNYDYALGIFLIYALTLSIFPGFLFENTGEHNLGTWYPLVLIAMYNVLDFISRYTPLVPSLKIENRKGLMVAIGLRFLFVPAFYFTAKYADQGWMILLTSLLGFTNGHLTVCLMTVAPKGYTGPEQNALGNVLAFCLMCGIFAGVLLDLLWIIGNGKF